MELRAIVNVKLKMDGWVVGGFDCRRAVTTHAPRLCCISVGFAGGYMGIARHARG